jgi:ankyrin repeat protein
MPVSVKQHVTIILLPSRIVISIWKFVEGDKVVAKLLPVHGAVVDYKINDGVTPSTLAENEVAELLLNNKAEINAKNTFGYTPLSWAAQNGHTDMVELLLKNKAEINAKDNLGRNALSVDFSAQFGL